MTDLAAGDLHQVLTRWPREAGGFGSGELVPNIRWAAVRRDKTPDEMTRTSVETASIITSAALTVGDCVALGDHVSTAPGLVPTVHEVEAYRETTGFDAAIVKRATARPLLGTLWQQLELFPMYRQAAGRGYNLNRAARIYEGPASIRMLSQAAEIYSGGQSLNYSAILTVPYTANIDGIPRLEAVWSGPLGIVVFDVVGPLFDPDQSPFWRTLAAVLRTPQTTEAP